MTLFVHGKENAGREHFLGLIGIQHRLGSSVRMMFSDPPAEASVGRSWLPQLRFVEQKAHFLFEGLGILRIGAIFRLKFLDHLFGPVEKLISFCVMHQGRMAGLT